ncbi:MAG: DUF885 family protein, partial [Bacteroidota bacterium]
QQFPDWASSVGQAAYHQVLVLPSQEKRQQDLSFCQTYLDSFQLFDPEQLSNIEREQWQENKEQLQGYLQQIQGDQSWQQDPSFYNVLGPCQHVLNLPKTALENKLDWLYTKMQSIPQYYQIAQENLSHPNKRLVDKAMMEHEATFTFFHVTLRDSLQASQRPISAKNRFLEQLEQSQNSIKDYLAFCNSMRFEFDQLKR